MLARMLLSKTTQYLLLKNCSVQILTKPSWFLMERTYTFKKFTVFIPKAVISYAEAKMKYFEIYYIFGKYPNTSFDFDSKVMKIKALSQ